MDHRLGFEPAREELAGECLPVEGTLPKWLSGTLLRNGPGTFRAGDRQLNHWFDGFAMVRRFAIRDGAVEYANRFLESDAYEHAQEYGDLGFREFATDPEVGLVGRLKRLVSTRFTDNAPVNVERRNGRLFATTESPRAVRFDPETLATRGHDDREEFGTTRTAHPHYDARRGETVGYATRFGRNPGYTVYRIPDGETNPEVVGGVTVDRPAYLHSFGLTEQYVVLTEGPFVVEPLDLLRDSAIVESFAWKPERGTRFILLDRDSGDVVGTHSTDPFFVFHHVNAYEADRSIVLDLIAYPDASVIDALYLENLRSASPALPTGELRRYRLPFANEDVERETLYPGHIELPTIDYAHRNTRSYCYAYGVGNRKRPPEDFQNQLVKVDVESRRTETWHESDCYPGEPLFVPAPGNVNADREDATAARSEDDGVLLSVVLDTQEKRSFLLVLDARSFEERARAIVPHPIPFGFHGQFYRDGEERPTRSMA